MLMSSTETRTAAALEVRGLTVSYRSAPALWEVDCAFPAGHLSAIVGPNGAGKSTLLKAALGLVPADAGRVLIDGTEGKDALDRVAYVPQAESVDWEFPITVREVVEMGRYRSTGWFRRVGRADRAAVRRPAPARLPGKGARPARPGARDGRAVRRDRRPHPGGPARPAGRAARRRRLGRGGAPRRGAGARRVRLDPAAQRAGA